MGWLFMHSMGVHKTPRDYLDAQYTINTPELPKNHPTVCPRPTANLLCSSRNPVCRPTP